EPLADLSGPRPFVEVQQVLDPDYPDGHHYYWKSTNVPALTDDVVDILLAHAVAAPSEESTVDVWLNGGAIDRGTGSTSAFPARRRWPHRRRNPPSPSGSMAGRSPGSPVPPAHSLGAATVT